MSDSIVVIELHHESDPRYVMMHQAIVPAEITMEELGNWVYGKVLIMPPRDPDLVYQHEWRGEQSVWVKP